MGHDGHVLDHGDTVDVLGDDLARVTMECDLGLVEGLQNVITRLSVWNSFTAETVSHPAALLVQELYLF